VRQPELVLARRPEDEPVLLQPLVVEAEVGPDVDIGADDVAGVAGDNGVEGGTPEIEAGLDVIPLADGGVADHGAAVVSLGRRGEPQQEHTRAGSRRHDLRQAHHEPLLVPRGLSLFRACRPLPARWERVGGVRARRSPGSRGGTPQLSWEGHERIAQRLDCGLAGLLDSCGLAGLRIADCGSTGLRRAAWRPSPVTGAPAVATGSILD